MFKYMLGNGANGHCHGNLAQRLKDSVKGAELKKGHNGYCATVTCSP